MHTERATNYKSVPFVIELDCCPFCGCRFVHIMKNCDNNRYYGKCQGCGAKSGECTDLSFAVSGWNMCAERCGKKVYIPQQRLPGSEDYTQICPTCNGKKVVSSGRKGVKDAHVCFTCNGTGKLQGTYKSRCKGANMSEITFPKVSWISGSVNTDSVKLVCVPSHKYQEVDIAFDLPKSMNIGCIEISRQIPFEQASKFGEELVLRWNTALVEENQTNIRSHLV